MGILGEWEGGLVLSMCCALWTFAIDFGPIFTAVNYEKKALPLFEFLRHLVPLTAVKLSILSLVCDHLKKLVLDWYIIDLVHSYCTSFSVSFMQ